MERWQDGRVNITPINALHALNLEFHVVFSGGFAIFPFLPTVSITSITDFLSRIEEHGTTFGSDFDFFGEPFAVPVESDKH